MGGSIEFEDKTVLPPIKLTPRQEELCRRLDSLNQLTIRGQEMSLMFRGAIYTTREECRSNPDWIAQSAHSFREILYPFYKKERKIKVKDAFKSYGSVTVEEKNFKHDLGKVYGEITKVAHHQPVSIEDYEKLIEEFQEALYWVLYRQVDIHNQIDKLLSESKPD